MPINIDLGDDWVLTTDSHQYILNKRKSKKGGDIKLEGEGWYMSFDALLHGFAHRRLMLSRAKNFEDFAKAVAKLNKDINAIGDIFREAMKSYNPEEDSNGIEDQTAE